MWYWFFRFFRTGLKIPLLDNFFIFFVVVDFGRIAQKNYHKLAFALISVVLFQTGSKILLNCWRGQPHSVLIVFHMVTNYYYCATWKHAHFCDSRSVLLRLGRGARVEGSQTYRSICVVWKSNRLMDFWSVYNLRNCLRQKLINRVLGNMWKCSKSL